MSSAPFSSDSLNCLSLADIVCAVWSNRRKQISRLVVRIRYDHGCHGLHIAYFQTSSCSGPIETLVFVCRSLCCLCRTPLPPSLPHIFTFFPLSESCWQVYHLTSSLELWSTNNARYKGENPFRVEIFPITTSESEWTSYQISANILSTSHSCNPDS